MPLFGIGMKVDHDHCWVFQICWHIEYSTLTASSFRIWNSSAGIPSLPLALFVVMLRTTHLHTPGYLALGEWSHHNDYLGHSDHFLYSFVYSCLLFLVSSGSVTSILFLSFIVPIFAWDVPLVSLNFLKRSLIFPILLFSSVSLHCSLKKVLTLLDLLWNSKFRWVYLSFSPLSFASLFF